MAEQAFRARLVVVGGDDQHGVGAGLVRLPGELDGLLGRIGAGAGDHRDPPARRRDHGAHDVHVLLVGEGGRFAGRPDGHEAVDPALDLVLDQPPQVVIGDRAVAGTA